MVTISVQKNAFDELEQIREEISENVLSNRMEGFDFLFLMRK
jgi:hypothetical protein